MKHRVVLTVPNSTEDGIRNVVRTLLNPVYVDVTVESIEQILSPCERLAEGVSLILNEVDLHEWSVKNGWVTFRVGCETPAEQSTLGGRLRGLGWDVTGDTYTFALETS